MNDLKKIILMIKRLGCINFFSDYGHLAELYQLKISETS